MRSLQAVQSAAQLTRQASAAGETSTGMLLGLQLPPDTADAFAAAQHELKDAFVFEELAGEALQVFNMFIS